MSDRLLLMPVGVEHAADLERLYSDPLVSYWTGPWTPAGVQAWAQGMAERWTHDGVGKWMAYARSDGTLVGRGGLSRTALGDETVLEVGWVVRDELTGRRLCLRDRAQRSQMGSDLLPELPVVAFTEVHNLASVAVMRRLGLHSSGVISREGLIAGRVGLHPKAPFALYRQVVAGQASP